MKPTVFEAALQAEGITGTLADLARSIFTQESAAGKNTKTSNRGARGGMQVLPGTFAEVADKDWNIDDPMQNARAGIRYLGARFKQGGGDPFLAAAGYYGGPGGLEKARRGVGVNDPVNPRAPDTLRYAREVVGRMPQAAETSMQESTILPPVLDPNSSWAQFSPPQAPVQAQPTGFMPAEFGADNSLAAARERLLASVQGWGKTA